MMIHLVKKIERIQIIYVENIQKKENKIIINMKNY